MQYNTETSFNVDILKHHIIPHAPECFLSAARWTRITAMHSLMDRRYTDTTREFWDTLGIISCGLGVDYARGFIMLNKDLQAGPEIAPMHDLQILNTYTLDESRYIVKWLLIIPPCGVLNMVTKAQRYFNMLFSIYYSHKLGIRRSHDELVDLIHAVMRHYPDIITRWLQCMSVVYGGSWLLNHDEMLLAMQIIESDYPEWVDASVFAIIRKRIDKNLASAHTNAKNLLDKIYPSR